jgi:hypothetical protein
MSQAVAWFAMAFALNHAWSYPWDFVGALLNLALVLWAFDRFHHIEDLLSWRLWLLLTALALNRESSLLILASLGVVVLAIGCHQSAWGGFRRISMAIIAATGTNIAAIVWLRHTLFAESTRPAGVSTSNELPAGNFLQLGDNWRLLATPSAGIMTRSLALAIFISLLALCATYLWQICRLFRKGSQLHPGRLFAGVYLVAAAIAILIFADMSEFRIYFELIPFYVVIGAEVVAPGKHAEAVSMSIP